MRLIALEMLVHFFPLTRLRSLESTVYADYRRKYHLAEATKE